MRLRGNVTSTAQSCLNPTKLSNHTAANQPLVCWLTNTQRGKTQWIQPSFNPQGNSQWVAIVPTSRLTPCCGRDPFPICQSPPVCFPWSSIHCLIYPNKRDSTSSFALKDHRAGPHFCQHPETVQLIPLPPVNKGSLWPLPCQLHQGCWRTLFPTKLHVENPIGWLLRATLEQQSNKSFSLYWEDSKNEVCPGNFQSVHQHIWSAGLLPSVQHVVKYLGKTEVFLGFFFFLVNFEKTIIWNSSEIYCHKRKKKSVCLGLQKAWNRRKRDVWWTPLSEIKTGNRNLTGLPVAISGRSQKWY